VVVHGDDNLDIAILNPRQVFEMLQGFFVVIVYLAFGVFILSALQLTCILLLVDFVTLSIATGSGTRYYHRTPILESHYAYLFRASPRWTGPCPVSLRPLSLQAASSDIVLIRQSYRRCPLKSLCFLRHSTSCW